LHYNLEGNRRVAKEVMRALREIAP
jgi:hypothetical protein